MRAFEYVYLVVNHYDPDGAQIAGVWYNENRAKKACEKLNEDLRHGEYQVESVIVEDRKEI